MTRFRRLALLLTLSLLAGCSWISSWNGDERALKPKLDASQTPVEELYNNGVDALSQKRYVAANRQFDLVE
jgi:outer membrane protein assembly factor BamD (BamD/ComL family)